MGITLYEFLNASVDSFYKINIFNNNSGTELLNQIEVGDIENELEKIGCEDFMEREITSWDINEKRELTLNIE